eukprot:4043650-Pyramimonas_sp.AAC.1
MEALRHQAVRADALTDGVGPRDALLHGSEQPLQMHVAYHTVSRKQSECSPEAVVRKHYVGIPPQASEPPSPAGLGASVRSGAHR